MTKKLGILTLHGMGRQPKDYYKKLTKRIKRRLGQTLWDQILVEPIYYHNEMQENQEKMWDRMKGAGDLDATILRKFMLYSFSDAVNISDYSTPKSMGYYATDQVRSSVNKLSAMLEDERTPIIAIGQSLGNQVLANYIWDAQNKKGIFEDDHANQTEKLSQLRVWFSTGNNMPFFVSGIAEEDISPINKPNDLFEWFNYYDRDDVLGWPMAEVSPSYKESLGVKDIEIQTGLSTVSSHTSYWRDNSFIRPLSKKIRTLL